MLVEDLSEKMKNMPNNILNNSIRTSFLEKNVFPIYFTLHQYRSKSDVLEILFIILMFLQLLAMNFSKELLNEIDPEEGDSFLTYITVISIEKHISENNTLFKVQAYMTVTVCTLYYGLMIYIYHSDRSKRVQFEFVLKIINYLNVFTHYFLFGPLLFANLSILNCTNAGIKTAIPESECYKAYNFYFLLVISAINMCNLVLINLGVCFFSFINQGPQIDNPVSCIVYNFEFYMLIYRAGKYILLMVVKYTTSSAAVWFYAYGSCSSLFLTWYYSKYVYYYNEKIYRVYFYMLLAYTWSNISFLIQLLLEVKGSALLVSIGVLFFIILGNSYINYKVERKILENMFECRNLIEIVNYSSMINKYYYSQFNEGGKKIILSGILNRYLERAEEYNMRFLSKYKKAAEEDFNKKLTINNERKNINNFFFDLYAHLVSRKNNVEGVNSVNDKKDSELDEQIFLVFANFLFYSLKNYYLAIDMMIKCRKEASNLTLKFSLYSLNREIDAEIKARNMIKVDDNTHEPVDLSIPIIYEELKNSWFLNIAESTKKHRQFWRHALLTTKPEEKIKYLFELGQTIIEGIDKNEQTFSKLSKLNPNDEETNNLYKSYITVNIQDLDIVRKMDKSIKENKDKIPLEAMSLYYSLFNSEAYFLVVDGSSSNGKIIYSNDRSRTFLDYDARGISNINFEEIIPRCFREHHPKYMEEYYIAAKSGFLDRINSLFVLGNENKIMPCKLIVRLMPFFNYFDKNIFACSFIYKKENHNFFLLNSEGNIDSYYLKSRDYNGVNLIDSYSAEVNSDITFPSCMFLKEEIKFYYISPEFLKFCYFDAKENLQIDFENLKTYNSYLFIPKYFKDYSKNAKEKDEYFLMNKHYCNLILKSTDPKIKLTKMQEYVRYLKTNSEYFKKKIKISKIFHRGTYTIKAILKDFKDDNLYDTVNNSLLDDSFESNQMAVNSIRQPNLAPGFNGNKKFNDNALKLNKIINETNDFNLDNDVQKDKGISNGYMQYFEKNTMVQEGGDEETHNLSSNDGSQMSASMSKTNSTVGRLKKLKQRIYTNQEPRDVKMVRWLTLFFFLTVLLLKLSYFLVLNSNVNYVADQVQVLRMYNYTSVEAACIYNYSRNEWIFREGLRTAESAQNKVKLENCVNRLHGSLDLFYNDIVIEDAIREANLEVSQMNFKGEADVSVVSLSKSLEILLHNSLEVLDNASALSSNFYFVFQNTLNVVYTELNSTRRNIQNSISDKIDVSFYFSLVFMMSGIVCVLIVSVFLYFQLKKVISTKIRIIQIIVNLDKVSMEDRKQLLDVFLADFYKNKNIQEEEEDNLFLNDGDNDGESDRSEKAIVNNYPEEAKKEQKSIEKQFTVDPNFDANQARKLAESKKKTTNINIFKQVDISSVSRKIILQSLSFYFLFFLFVCSYIVSLFFMAENYSKREKEHFELYHSVTHVYSKNYLAFDSLKELVSTYGKGKVEEKPVEDYITSEMTELTETQKQLENLVTGILGRYSTEDKIYQLLYGDMCAVLKGEDSEFDEIECGKFNGTVLRTGLIKTLASFNENFKLFYNTYLSLKRNTLVQTEAKEREDKIKLFAAEPFVIMETLIDKYLDQSYAVILQSLVDFNENQLLNGNIYLMLMLIFFSLVALVVYFFVWSKIFNIIKKEVKDALTLLLFVPTKELESRDNTMNLDSFLHD